MNWYKKAMLKLAGSEYGWISVNVPPKVTKKTIAFGKSIPEEEVYLEKKDGKWKFGIENTPHITVKYGVHTTVAEKVKKALGDAKKGTVTLGKTSLFENEDYDVLKVSVVSPTLRRLHKLFTDNLTCTDEYDHYTPHLTIAYLKPGNGKKYKGDTRLEGITFEIDEVIFEDKNDKATTISLS